LADYGGEPIQRLGKSFADIFPKDRTGHFFGFTWSGNEYVYRFKALPCTGLGNKKLFIDGDGLTKEKNLSDMISDMIAIILFAASSDVSSQAGLESCDIGVLLGDDCALDSFVRQRYIMVSRITGGATANSLGQIAQNELVIHLKDSLGEDYSVTRNGSVKLDGYAKSMPFDVVVRKGNDCVGIEVSFQVTTNSTIERKAGQASDRMKSMHDAGYSIAYVIDGAGNFQRSAAISEICSNSDCTVAYNTDEFDILSQWIKSKF
jgi:hypothetical protein